MLLTVDGVSYRLGEEDDMRRVLTINCSETTATEWNRPNSVEGRLRAHHAMLARRANLRETCELVPRKRSLVSSVVAWLNQEI